VNSLNIVLAKKSIIRASFEECSHFRIQHVGEVNIKGKPMGTYRYMEFYAD
jgi:hypothetical protein